MKSFAVLSFVAAAAAVAIPDGEWNQWCQPSYVTDYVTSTTTAYVTVPTTVYKTEYKTATVTLPPVTSTTTAYVTVTTTAPCETKSWGNWQ